MTLSHAHFGVILRSRRSRGPVLYICAEFEADISIRSKVIRVSQNFEIRSRDPGHAQLGVVLWSRRSRGALSMSAKFEADISIRSEVIRGSQNFEIGSRDPGHAHLGVDLWSGRSWSPFSMSVPNLNQISPFLQKLCGVPKFRNLVT